MIGIPREIATLSLWAKRNHPHRWSYNAPPHDWQLLGSGRDKMAYLSPSGIVYKIATPWACQAEINAIKKALALPPLDGWYVPDADLYESKHFHYDGDPYAIIAMEYIDGWEDPGDFEEWDKAEAHWEVGDICSCNVLVQSCGTRVLIDWSG